MLVAEDGLAEVGVAGDWLRWESRAELGGGLSTGESPSDPDR
jgi:hypothetical protein